MRSRSLIALAVFAPLAVFAAPANAQSASHSTRAATKPAVLAAPAAAPAPAPAEPRSEARLQAIYGVKGGLTADTTADRAVATSPQIRERAAGVEAAEAEASAATLAVLLPKLDIKASYVRLSPITQAPLVKFPEGNLVTSSNPNTDDTDNPLTGQPDNLVDNENEPLFRSKPPVARLPVVLDNVSFNANLTIPLSDYVLRLSKVARVGERSMRAAAFEERAARALATTSARIAFYEWARARGQVILGEQGVEQARGHLADAKSGLALGVATNADALRAEAAARRAELQLTQARHGAALTEERLRAMLHESPGTKHEVGENVLAATPDRGPESLEALTAEAGRRRPELRALDEAAAAQRASASLRKADILPRLDAIAGATYANPNPRFVPALPVFAATWQVGVVLSWSPTEIPVALAAASASEARAAQTAARRDAVVDAVRLEVTDAWHATIAAREAVASSEQTLTASEEAYRMRRELYRGGRASYVELADAETDVTRARLDYVSARIDGHIARARLDHAVGRDAPDGDVGRKD